MQHRRVIDRKLRCQRHLGTLRPVRQLQAKLRQLRGTRRQQIVTSQIVRALGLAALLQVLRRGTQQRGGCAEETLADLGPRRRMRPNRHVPGALGEPLRVESDLERHVSEGFEEARHQR
jgi:hypothetical protein